MVGSTTAGADGNVSTIILRGNISTWISGLGVYYSAGRETQRAGIRVGRDEVLEKAVQLIEPKQQMAVPCRRVSPCQK